MKTILLPFIFAVTTLFGVNPQNELYEKYEFAVDMPSDICEHVPVLRELARECSSVTEIGVRTMVSTWGILLGLSESRCRTRSYIGIDLKAPPKDILNDAVRLAEGNNISFEMWLANDMYIDILPTDFLFIDSLHTYAHLTYELEKFSPQVSKYIAMHDTSAPWGSADEWCYDGDYSEYPEFIDRNKRGLWLAVEDFLVNHPEWVLIERRLNCHGFTILQRVN